MSRGNLLGLGLVLVGAVTMLVSVFLPVIQLAGPFGRVQDNSLILHQGFWILVALAFAIAATGYQASRPGQRAGYWIGTLALCVAGGLVALVGTYKDARTLYPVDANGNLDMSHPTVGSLGIAIYVAGVGIALAAIGSLMLRQSHTAATTAPRAPSPPVLAPVFLAGLLIIVGVGLTIDVIGTRTDALVGAGAAAVLYAAMAATAIIARI